VKTVEDHPAEDAKHLYIVEVDSEKEGIRKIVSALRQAYPDKDQLVGRTVLVAANIKPSNFKGVKSNGTAFCSVPIDWVAGADSLAGMRPHGVPFRHDLDR